MQKVDMSPQAITFRLKRIEQLRRLCVSLGKTTFPTMNTKDDRAQTDLKEKAGGHRK